MRLYVQLVALWRPLKNKAPSNVFPRIISSLVDSNARRLPTALLRRTTTSTLRSRGRPSYWAAPPGSLGGLGGGHEPLLRHETDRASRLDPATIRYPPPSTTTTTAAADTTTTTTTTTTTATAAVVTAASNSDVNRPDY